MKLCVNLSLMYHEHELIDRFSAAKRDSFNAVEIQFPYSNRYQDLHRELQRNEQTLVLINLPAGDLMSGGAGLACHPQKVDEFKFAVDQCLVYAQELDVKCVNLLAGRAENPKRADEHYDIFLSNLDYCADQLQSIQVKTVFEAINTVDMPDFLIHSTDQMLQVMKDLNHPNVAMQYDLYHMSRMAEPIAEQLPQIIGDIGHIQFADTPDRHQPGTGNLPFSQLITQLRGLDYKQWISAEYNPDGPSSDSLDWLQLFNNTERGIAN